MSVTQTIKAAPKRKNSRRVMLALAPVLMAAMGAGVLLGMAGRAPAGHIAGGVRAGGTPIGGLSREEARAKLQKLNLQNRAVPLVLHFATETGIKHKWTPDAAKLGLGLDVNGTLDAAEKAGQAGFIGRAASVLTGGKTSAIPLKPTVDEKKLLRYLKRQIAVDVNRPARNAKLILLAKGGHKILPEKTGIKVNIDACAAAITKAWTAYYQSDAPAAASTPDSGEKSEQTPKDPSDTAPTGETPKPAADKTTPLDVTLSLLVAKPAITGAMLGDLRELGSYSTHFALGDRGSNIALATSHINGTLLAPGQIFSYNKVVGPRIESAGFRDAPVIVKGELVPGVGGGICQVSSTLYNAVLLSDLKIVSRSHHAFPVHYLPAGRDATVVDGAIDFQFQNNTPTPIYIAASSGGGHLSFRILGKKTPGKTVAIELANHEILPTPPPKTARDPSLYVGVRRFKDRGHRGHRVTVYRVVKVNDALVKRELISHDHYRAFAPLVLAGTKPRKVKVKAAPAVSKTPAVPNPAPPAPTVDPAPQ